MQYPEAASDKALMTLFDNSSINFELKFQTNRRLLPHATTPKHFPDEKFPLKTDYPFVSHYEH